MNTTFSSHKNKTIDDEMLYQLLDKVNIPYELHHLETSFGIVQVINFGAQNKKPLVIIPGTKGCASVVLEASRKLAKQYAVYIIAESLQNNNSIALANTRTQGDFAKCLFEIIARLGLTKITLLGFSFGAIIATQLLLYDLRHVAGTYLIMPQGIIPSQYRTILKKIKSPVYIVADVNDVFFPGVFLLQDAKEMLPALRDTLLLKHSNHIPNKKDIKEIIEFINKGNKLV